MSKLIHSLRRSILLLHMTRQIPPRIIQMHKRAINHRDTFEHILQTLAQIMAIPQTRVLIKHNIDLDIELVARVISLQALDLLDRLREAHGQVEQDVALVGRGGCAC